MTSSIQSVSLESNRAAGNRWASWGFSVALHLALLSALWILTDSFQVPQTEAARAGRIVLAIDSPDSQQQYLSESETMENKLETEIDSPAQAAQAAEQARELEQTLSRLDQTGKPDALSQQPDRSGFGNSAKIVQDANSMLQTPNTSAGEKARKMSEADLKRLQEEQALVASRLPKGEPTTISIFGSGNLTGRTFVFVIDQSDSMGTGGLGVIDGSKAELSRAVEELHDYHQFQIVGYNVRTTTMRHRKLLYATEKNKDGIAPFLDGMTASGGTEHIDGLMIALGFAPDIIVLMSDGGDPEMNDNQLLQIRRIAGEKTEIHALQFGVGEKKFNQNEKQNFMVRLAEQNRGTYRYIDVGKWQRNKE